MKTLLSKLSATVVVGLLALCLLSVLLWVGRMWRWPAGAR
ncbi:hypothetical protein FICKIIDM_00910 [Xanthomonas citri pv. punicae]|nr:hypothetical protein FICKIIDM_00910 [Xanthomonas citri pv. punicae]